MKLEIIALLICTIMGRTRRRRDHHKHVSGDGGNSSYDTDGKGNRVEKPVEVPAEVPAEVAPEVAAGRKRFMRRLGSS